MRPIRCPTRGWVVVVVGWEVVVVGRWCCGAARAWRGLSLHSRQGPARAVVVSSGRRHERLCIADTVYVGLLLQDLRTARAAMLHIACVLACIECAMVPPGLEPGTLRLLAVRSDELSYETKMPSEDSRQAVSDS